jgi:hypothetical protein
MNIRLLPPTEAALQTCAFKGRSYSAVPGSFLDFYDADALVLEANGWIHVAPSGPTSSRPVGALGPYAAVPGTWFYDTTISKLIVYDGANWRSPVDGSAV